MQHRKTSLRIITTLAAAGLAVALPATSQATSPHEVDPLSLTPPLNPTFTWTCFEAGAGITCQGDRFEMYGPEPVDFDCGGQPVYVSGSGYEFMTRWHTVDGLATRTIVNLSYPEDRFTLSADGSDPAVVVKRHWNRHYVYPVPGDLTSRVLTEVGQTFMAFSPKGGKIFQATGLLEWAPGEDFETVAAQHGRDDFATGGDFVEAVCEALT